VILGEQSDTVDVSGNTISTDTASEGTEAPAKKTKIMLTEKEQAFASLFQPAGSNKPRKIDLRDVSGRGSSLKRQGTTKHDVMCHTFTPLLLLLSITGKRQSKVRKGSASANEDVFSTHCMSWATRSRCLTSMG
jgi:hypothetical protein